MEGVTDYIIQRSHGGEFQQVGRVPAYKTTYEDHGLVANKSYLYRVQAVNQSGSSDPGLSNVFETLTQKRDWQKQNFDNPDGPDANLYAVDALGIPNLLRFAFNSPPGQGLRQANYDRQSGGTPLVTHEPNGHQRIEFNRRRPESNPGITYVLECSNDLKSWHAVAPDYTAELLDDQFEWIRWMGTTASGPRFYRVIVKDNPEN